MGQFKHLYLKIQCATARDSFEFYTYLLTDSVSLKENSNQRFINFVAVKLESRTPDI